MPKPSRGGSNSNFISAGQNGSRIIAINRKPNAINTSEDEMALAGRLLPGVEFDGRLQGISDSEFNYSDADGNAYDSNGGLIEHFDMRTTFTWSGYGEGEWSEKQKQQYISKAVGVSDKTELAKYEHAIKSFTNGNMALKTGLQNEDQQYLNSYISKAPKWKGGATYRGLSLKQADGETFLNNVKPGQPFKSSGISSWSTQKSIALGFADSYAKEPKIPVVIRCATQSTGTGLGRLSTFPNQYEVLNAQNARYRYKSTPVKKSIQGRTYYEIEVEEY